MLPKVMIGNTTRHDEGAGGSKPSLGQWKPPERRSKTTAFDTVRRTDCPFRSQRSIGNLAVMVR